MNQNEAMTQVRQWIDEYIRAGEEVDRNELRLERLIAEIREIDEESSALVDEQAAITARFAPLFEAAGVGSVKAYHGGKTYLIAHEPGDTFLTVDVLSDVGPLASSLASDDSPAPTDARSEAPLYRDLV